MNTISTGLNKKKILPYLLVSGISFAITAIIILVFFALSGIAPFGDNSLLFRDGEIQMMDLFCWYKDVLTGRSSIDYTFTKSLGGSNFSVYSYYLASPFSFLIVFFDKAQVPLFINIIYLLKAAFAAAFMGIYLKHRFEPKGKLKVAICVILSVSYALNPFFLAQSSNTMWLDGAYMLPLLLVGAEILATNKKSLLFIVASALAICFNWYSGIVDLMFSCFWFLFRLIYIAVMEDEDKKIKAKNAFNSIIRFGISCICAIFISAWILVPTLLKLSDRTHGKGGLSMLKDLSLMGSIPSVALSYSFGMISQKGNVSLFAGSFVLLGVALLFIATNKKLKEKLLYALLLLFTIAMFVWQPLVALFSMLRVVESFWYRYSYLGVFVLILMAAVFYMDSDKSKLKAWMPPVIAVVFSLLIFGLMGMFPSRLEDYIFTGSFSKLAFTAFDTLTVPLIAKIAFPIALSVLLCILILVWKKRDTYRISVAAVICLVIATEFLLSQLVLAKTYATPGTFNLENYTKNELSLLSNIKDDSFSRLVQTSYHSIHLEKHPASYNEPMAYGFKSVTSFVSDPDEKTIVFMDKGGYKSHSTTITNTSSENLAFDSLLGVKYIMLPSTSNEGAGLTYVTGIEGFKNLYTNPYSFPIAFVYEGTGDFESSATNPALYINDTIKRLTGVTEDLFTPVEYEASQDGLTLSYKLDLGTDYDPNTKILYVNFESDSDIAATLLVDGEECARLFDFLAPSMVKVNTTNKDVTLSLQFESGDENQIKPASAQFYLFDLNILKKASEIANSKMANDIVYKDGYMKLTANDAKDGESLFISIPKEKGWTITRNGEVIDCNEIDANLMSIPLTNGTNTIEMQYKLPYKSAGMAISAVGIILLICTFAYPTLISKINTRKSSKTHHDGKKHN